MSTQKITTEKQHAYDILMHHKKTSQPLSVSDLAIIQQQFTEHEIACMEPLITNPNKSCCNVNYSRSEFRNLKIKDVVRIEY